MTTIGQSERTRGEVYEGVAFQFCKVATVALLAGRYVLPVAASLCAILYVAAYVKGKRDTRCVLRYPLLISAFWGVIAIISVVLMVTKRSIW